MKKIGNGYWRIETQEELDALSLYVTKGGDYEVYCCDTRAQANQWIEDNLEYANYDRSWFKVGKIADDFSMDRAGSWKFITDIRHKMPAAELNQAARALGSKGGKANTEAQNAARRENAKKGGRPKNPIGYNSKLHIRVSGGYLKTDGDSYLSYDENGRQVGRFHLFSEARESLLRKEES